MTARATVVAQLAATILAGDRFSLHAITDRDIAAAVTVAEKITAVAEGWREGHTDENAA